MVTGPIPQHTASAAPSAEEAITAPVSVVEIDEKRSAILYLHDAGGKPLERVRAFTNTEMHEIMERVRAELNAVIDVQRGTRNPLKKESELITVGETRVLIAAYERRVDAGVKESIERFNQVATSFTEALNKMNERATGAEKAMRDLTCSHFALEMSLRDFTDEVQETFWRRTWRGRWSRFMAVCLRARPALHSFVRAALRRKPPVTQIEPDEPWPRA